MIYGKLGWTEREYYESTPYAVTAAVEGYFDKLDEQQMMFRRLAGVFHRTMGGEADERTYWPIWSDREDLPEQATASFKMTDKDFLAEVFRKHGVQGYA